MIVLGQGIIQLLTKSKNKIIMEDEKPEAVFSNSMHKAGDEIIKIMHKSKPA